MEAKVGKNKLYYSIVIILILCFSFSLGQEKREDRLHEYRPDTTGIEKTNTSNIKLSNNSIPILSEKERDAIALCDNTLNAVQTMVTILSFIVVLVSIVSIGIVLLYRARIEKIDEVRKELEEKVLKLENKASEIRSIIENTELETKKIEQNRVEIEQNLREMKDSLFGSDYRKGQEIVNYKIVAASVSAITKVLLVQDRNSPRRLLLLQELAQILHPVGITPFITVLLDEKEKDILRITAAYGLGRYHENKDTNEYWTQIAESFRMVLANKAISEEFACAVIKATIKYVKETKEILFDLMDWSKDNRVNIRRCCADAFGECLINNSDMIQRLKEMIESDTDEEVRLAARKAERKIEEYIG